VQSAATSRIVLARVLPLVIVLLCSRLAAQTEAESGDAGATITSSRSVMVTVDGPRKGEAPSRYFNVQGRSSRGNSKYASFGLLDFDIEPRATKVGDALKLTLVLTQSIPPFAKPGRILFFLADDADEDIAGLKFAPEGASALGDVASRAIACGEATFTIDRTGHKDRFELRLSDDLRPLVDRVVGEGGRLRLLVVPGEADVAATYFGADQPEQAVRPFLLVE